MKVQAKIVNPLLTDLPQYATTGSAGMDLHACIEAAIMLKPGETQLIPTGLSIHLSDPKFAAIALPRSGMGHKRGLVLGNLVGLIDADYQGEIFISLWNRGSTLQTIEPLERIAQLVVIPVTQVELELVDEFEASERGAGGFGSTGS